MAFDTLSSLAMGDMGKPSYPITVGVSNIALKNKKLDSLKLAVLKDICNQQHLTTSGLLSWKNNFFKPFKNVVSAFFKSNVK